MCDNNLNKSSLDSTQMFWAILWMMCRIWRKQSIHGHSVNKCDLKFYVSLRSWFGIQRRFLFSLFGLSYPWMTKTTMHIKPNCPNRMKVMVSTYENPNPKCVSFLLIKGIGNWVNNFNWSTFETGTGITRYWYWYRNWSCVMMRILFYNIRKTLFERKCAAKLKTRSVTKYGSFQELFIQNLRTTSQKKFFRNNLPALQNYPPWFADINQISAPFWGWLCQVLMSASHVSNHRNFAKYLVFLRTSLNGPFSHDFCSTLRSESENLDVFWIHLDPDHN